MIEQLTDYQIEQLNSVAKSAGQAIMSVYQRDDVGIQHKADDSPLTQADLAAHQVIAEGLKALFPSVPQLSEEAADIPFSERRQWSEYWCIDPLDGTKEFINRNGDFTVNIALIQQGKPVFGVIYIPVTEELYWGGSNYGAFKQQHQHTEAISCRPLGDELVLIASRRHGQDKNDRLLANLDSRFQQVATLNRGSSLKMCMIAEGKADFYPRLFPTSEWDTAASQAIVEAAGGLLVNAETLQPLRYNQKDDLTNPYFLVFGDPDFPLQQLQLKS